MIEDPEFQGQSRMRKHAQYIRDQDSLRGKVMPRSKHKVAYHDRGRARTSALNKDSAAGIPEHTER